MSKVNYGQAIAAVVFAGISIVFCVLSYMQHYYHWREEKSRADAGLPVYDRYIQAGLT